MKVYGGVPPAPLMAQAFWNTKSTSRVGFGIRQALVIGFLCALVFGGLQLGTSTNIRAPPVTISRTQAQVSGVDQLAGATQSLLAGAGPAAGVSMTCSGTGASAVSCSTPRSAQPRPAISANDTWINITKSLVGGPTSTPGAMYLGVMDYDAYDGYIMYLGGSPNGGTFSQATWIYQEGKWTQLNELNPPSARYIEQMAYDPAANSMILFSGYVSGTCPSDTWSFSNGTWTQLSAVGPPGRYRGDFAYDADMKAMILTGGSNCAESYFYTDTWEYANNTWTNITSLVTGTPPGLVRAKMVWDAFDHEIVLYGGDDHAGSGTTETWIFKNMTWSESTLSPTPGARTYFQMVYDPQKSAVLLFGGSPTSDSGTCYQDTWVFQGGNWTKLTPLVSPSVRGYGMMAY